MQGTEKDSMEGSKTKDLESFILRHLKLSRQTEDKNMNVSGPGWSAGP